MEDTTKFEQGENERNRKREGERAPESMTVMNYRRVCVYVYVCERTGTVSVTVAQTSNLVAD